MLELILDPIKGMATLVITLFITDLLLRLISSKKTISLLGILSRLVARVAILIAKLNKLLPENRRK